jgi:PAS domain S-box-containing protein
LHVNTNGARPDAPSPQVDSLTAKHCEVGRTGVGSGFSAAVIVTDAELRIVGTVGDLFTGHGYSPEDWPGRPVREILPAEAWAELEPRFPAALAGEHQSFEYWTPDGRSAYWVQVSPWLQVHGVTSLVVVLQNITEQLQTRSRLERSESRLKESERMIGIGSWELALADDTVTFSAGFARVFGIAPTESCEFKTCERRIHPDDRRMFAEAIAKCLRTGSASCECRVVRPDGAICNIVMRGESVLGNDGRPDHLRGAVLDVTEQREAERERVAATSMFEQGFDAAPIAMALSDPATGRYTRVNDAMSRLLGRPSEELLRKSVRDVTHPDDRGKDDEARETMRLQGGGKYQIEKRYERPDGTVVWAAVHVVPVCRPDGTVQAFFAQKIDITEAKQREAELAGYVSDAVWLARIRDALDEDRMLLYWQPIVDLRTGEAVQRELLLRMRDADWTIVVPGQFLPVAERYGLISEIDRWVIRQAVRLAAEGVPTEFNVSAASISDPDVLRELATAIETTGVDPALLVVEVTETAMLDQLAAGRAFADQLRGLGCGLAIDDFGTGFASLSQLRHLHGEHLKIDMEFVRDITRNETDERLVRGIVGLAREFGQLTTAEGIEDEQTLAKLRDLGVDRGQGYLFARPRPVFDDAPPKAHRLEGTPGRADPVATIRAAFQAFADRDLEAYRRLFHPDVVLRPIATHRRANHSGGCYRGHAGLATYFRHVSEVWDDLQFDPTAFWRVDGGVVVFGKARLRVDGETSTIDALWVYRLRGDLIARVDVYPQRSGSHATPVTADRLQPAA